MKARVSIVRCAGYHRQAVEEKVREVIALAGGITAFVRPQTKVLVKPNLLLAEAPDAGITTHPEVARAVIRVLKEIGCQVFLGDGPSVWGAQDRNLERVFERTGMKAVAEEEKVQLARFQKHRWRGKFPLSSWLDQCDHLISLPKFKTHTFTILSGAVKNLYGLVSSVYKTELHKRYFRKEEFAAVLAEILREAAPSFTLVDGITAMEADGPATSGKLRSLGLLFAGADCVALDSVLAAVMGLEPFAILSTKIAAQRGLGVADLKEIEILGEKLEEAAGLPFLLPGPSLSSRIPRPIANLLKRMLRFYPKAMGADCLDCGACIEVCPNKIISRKNGKILIDYSRCLSCFCCQESCPNAAIKVEKSLLAKLLKL